MLISGTNYVIADALPHPVRRSRELLSVGERLPLLQRAERALRLLGKSAHASVGVLYVADAPGALRLAANLSSVEPSALLERWVKERFARELEDEQTLYETEVDPTAAPWNTLREGDLQHRMFVLTDSDGVAAAIAVLSRSDGTPGQCPPAQLRALADDLAECSSRTARCRDDSPFITISLSPSKP